MGRNDDFKFVNEDYSDLEIPREMISREELAQDSEVKKTGKQIKRSKLTLAVVALLVLVLGAFVLFYSLNQRAITNAEAEEDAVVSVY